jgi:hypothetical protein
VLLPITTDVLVEEARRLAAGDHRYSSRQLYYAACRAVERPPASITRGFIGLGALLVVLAGCVLWVHTFPLSLILAVLGVASLLAAPVNARVEHAREGRRALASRPLAASYEGFLSGPLSEALSSRPEAFTALVATGPHSPVGGPAGHPGTLRGAGGPLIVCDRPETAELLQANAARLPAGCTVMDVAGLLPDGGELDHELRDRRLVVLHDAGPAGCAVSPALRRSGGTDVVDAGIQPPASDAGLQVIEGAPARLPAGLEAALTPTELGWLRSGRRLELATLSPEEVVGLATAGCRAPAAPPLPGG